MKHIEERLRAGMTANGISPRRRTRSSRASLRSRCTVSREPRGVVFALIVYASAYLKVHHPQAFYAANAHCWPMGFYSPATLVKDAQRRGVRVKAIDVKRQRLAVPPWSGPGRRKELRVRLGLR